MRAGHDLSPTARPKHHLPSDSRSLQLRFCSSGCSISALSGFAIVCAIWGLFLSNNRARLASCLPPACEPGTLVAESLVCRMQGCRLPRLCTVLRWYSSQRDGADRKLRYLQYLLCRHCLKHSDLAVHSTTCWPVYSIRIGASRL